MASLNDIAKQVQDANDTANNLAEKAGDIIEQLPEGVQDSIETTARSIADKIPGELDDQLLDKAFGKQ